MRLLFLPEVLRAAGLTVHEHPGWRTRGNENWGPIRGITCHATADARTPAEEIGVLINGSATAPPPIAQLYLARNGDFHVVASGRCNHNFDGWGGPNKGIGNVNLLGIEAGNNNRGEPWPAVQLDAYRRGVAALCRRLGIPAARVGGHKEHQPFPDPVPGRGSVKTDPTFNMKQFRTAVAALIEEEDMPSAKEIADELARNQAFLDAVSKAVWGRQNPSEQLSYASIVRGQRRVATGTRDDLRRRVLPELAAIRGKVDGSANAEILAILGQLAAAVQDDEAEADDPVV